MPRWIGLLFAALLVGPLLLACPSDWPVDDDSADPSAADDDTAMLDDDAADDDSAT